MLQIYTRSNISHNESKKLEVDQRRVFYKPNLKKILKEKPMHTRTHRNRDLVYNVKKVTISEIFDFRYKFFKIM